MPWSSVVGGQVRGRWCKSELSIPGTNDRAIPRLEMQCTYFLDERRKLEKRCLTKCQIKGVYKKILFPLKVDMRECGVKRREKL